MKDGSVLDWVICVSEGRRHEVYHLTYAVEILTQFRYNILILDKERFTDELEVSKL